MGGGGLGRILSRRALSFDMNVLVAMDVGRFAVTSFFLAEKNVSGFWCSEHQYASPVWSLTPY